MITIIFIVGLLTALGCGWNVVFEASTWKHEASWIVGGIAGAGMMIGAVCLKHWGFA